MMGVSGQCLLRVIIREYDRERTEVEDFSDDRGADLTPLPADAGALGEVVATDVAEH